MTEHGRGLSQSTCQEHLLSLISGAHAGVHIWSPDTPVRAGESLKGQKQWNRRDPALVKWEERTGFESRYRSLPPFFLSIVLLIES